MKIRRLVTMLGLVAVITAFAAPAAMAQQTTTGDEIPPRLTQAIEKRCEHVPDRIADVETRIARLQGDADTPGSIAWVEKWADVLRDFGLDQFADLLDDRADLKRDGLELAKEWLDHLFEVQKACEDFSADAG
jgi:hypothetical protein